MLLIVGEEVWLKVENTLEVERFNVQKLLRVNLGVLATNDGG
jgi:hypothetical protein